MLHYKDGDLLKSDCTTILHQANCFSTMGAGIARGIAHLYPEAQLADKESLYTSEQKLGKFSLASVEGVTIVNLYGQYNIGKGLQTNYKALAEALDLFLVTTNSGLVRDLNVNLKKVGVPHFIGCGLAGGDWKVVRKILEDASLKHEIDIYVYKL